MKIDPAVFCAIANLYAVSDHYNDVGEAEAYGAFFAKDYVNVQEGKEVPLGREGMVASTMRATRARGDTLRRHWRSSPAMESVDAKTVKTSYYMHAYDITKDQPPILTHAGTVEDLVVLEDGEWVFGRRRMILDYLAWTTPKRPEGGAVVKEPTEPLSK